MRLTSFSDYALRLLILCASRGERLVTIAEAAEAYGISKNHLMKIAHVLVRADVLKSIRGRNGGLLLATGAEQISIGKVVRLMEKQSVLVECFAPASNSCVIAPACGLKFLLSEAAEDFYRRLDRATLADITRKPARILELLHVS
jgi:Rrf2 family nitric oxide-sensitive transcriptional repressor